MRLSHNLFSIFLAQAVTLAASAPEAATEADHHALGNPIQELGRYFKRVLGLETRDEITYYGDYGAYGEYGSYGSYSDNAFESSSSESSAQPTTTTTSTTTLTTSITLSVATTSSTGPNETLILADGGTWLLSVVSHFGFILCSFNWDHSLH